MGAVTSAPLLRTVVEGFGIQVLAWCIAAPLQTEKFYDLTGSMTFLYLTSSSFLRKKAPLLRNKVNTALVMTWAARLGSFLFQRVLRDGKDRRFDKVKTKPSVFLMYWVIQGLWCVLTAMPVYIINSKTSDPAEAQGVAVQDVVGWTIWAMGFALQVTADRQKSSFRSIPENHGKFITTGVWAWAQHPNYFGEMLMWAGLWVSSSAQMRGIELLSVLCPMFNIYLLRFVSGVPLLQKHARKVWGDDPVWQEYFAKTNLLVPNPFATPVTSGGAAAKPKAS